MPLGYQVIAKGHVVVQINVVVQVVSASLVPLVVSNPRSNPRAITLLIEMVSKLTLQTAHVAQLLFRVAS